MSASPNYSVSSLLKASIDSLVYAFIKFLVIAVHEYYLQSCINTNALHQLLRIIHCHFRGLKLYTIVKTLQTEGIKVSRFGVHKSCTKIQGQSPDVQALVIFQK